MPSDTPQLPIDRSTAAALLAWYADAGVDVVLQEGPRDRFAETQAEAQKRGAGGAKSASAPTVAARGEPTISAPPPDRRPAQSAAPPLPPMLDAPLAPDEATSLAEAVCAKATTLDELEAGLAAFEGCRLKVTASSLVFGEGDPHATLMIVGEVPGREEDVAGVPFAGAEGLLLSRMLAAVGLDRASVRLAPSLPWRPPGNRAPTPAELAICRPFLLRQIALVAPRVILCLGSTPIELVMGTGEDILRMRGRWIELERADGTSTAVTATLHPAFLLKQPRQKRLAWRDLLAVRGRLDEISAGMAKI